MLVWFDDLRHVTAHAIVLRVFLSMLSGGLIGLERSFKRRPAGFRTHILVCVGACITTLTSQFLYLNLHYPTDMARIGAQVIAGMGFIGAGTIIVTRKNVVKGLTTAAGLWAAAIIGLCFGGGFYEGGGLATVLLLFAEILLSKVEHKMLHRAPEMRYSITYEKNEALPAMMSFFRLHKIRVDDMEITRRHKAKEEEDSSYVTALFTLRLPPRFKKNALVEPIGAIDGVLSIDEM
ncbi:MAG: MgtC/SapB family protein [Lachnospiraceae bacterium]|nr:MgtC/SapB family protein [Lachnospiraceae bacterium]